MTQPAFEGVINFRDFGGGPGADGRRVKRGLLFRSGHHAAATDADLAAITDLDFGLLVDLRRPPERQREPARRPEGGSARLLEHGGALDDALPPHLQALTLESPTADSVNRQMLGGYRSYPVDPHYVRMYRDYFSILPDLDRPLLINCHAGKDRTGWLCALTLHVLGSPWDFIVEDYLATNLHNRADARLEQMKKDFEETRGHPIDDEVARLMMSVERHWLEESFASVAAAHGDVDGYLETVVGLTPAARAAIRARFLE